MHLLRDAVAHWVLHENAYFTLHYDTDLESLRDYPPFQELLRPTG